MGPPSAVQTKERLYGQLASSLGRMTRAMTQTADLCEQLQFDLHAMRVFAGLDAAKYVFLAFYIDSDESRFVLMGCEIDL